MRVQLMDSELDLLTRPIRGSGGFQSLLRNITRNIDFTTGTVEIPRSDVERIFRYSVKYGGGGFQSRLRALAIRLRRLAA